MNIRRRTLRIFALTTGVLLAAQCRQDIGDLLRDKKQIEAPPVSPATSVTNTLPYDGATGFGTNVKIFVAFDRSLTGVNISANTTNTTCSGILQVSANNFATCIQMTTEPVVNSAGTVYTLTPSGGLVANTTYKIKVSAFASAPPLPSLAATFTTSVGFTTASGTDTLEPRTLFATGMLSPDDGEATVVMNTGIMISFLELIDPNSVTINTADTNCTTTLQLSLDNFVTCVPMQAQPIWSHSGETLSMYPKTSLLPSQVYRMRITAGVRDLAGNAFTNYTTLFTTSAANNTTAPTVTSTVPANTAANTSIVPSITINFDKVMDFSTLVLNTLDTQCSGSVQISSDNFVTCVRMLPSDQFSLGFNQLIFWFQTPLANSTTYKIRVTTAAKDIFSNSITAFTTATGFTTQATGGGGATVQYLTPIDGSGEAEILTSFTAVFSKVMTPATVTANTTNTTCTGYSFQVSSDNFTTCLRMSTAPSATVGNTRFTVFPLLPLSQNTTYRTRITTAAQDYTSAPISLFTGIGVQTRM